MRESDHFRAGYRLPYGAETRRTVARRRMLTGVVALAAVGGFALIVAYAYNQGRQEGGGAVAPLISADNSPVKVRPDRPGGMDVPDRDKMVFERINPSAGPAPRLERLLPPPEEPVAPPAPAQTAVVSAAPLATTAAPKPAPVESDSATLPAEPPSFVAPPPPPTIPEVLGPPPAPPRQTPAPAVQPAPAKPSAQSASQPAARTPAEAAARPSTTPASKPVERQLAAVTSGASDAGGKWRVQLASLKSEADAMKTWALVRKKHPAELGSLSPRVAKADLGAKGVYYRLQAGPVADESAARTLCATLKGHNQGCIIVRP